MKGVLRISAIVLVTVFLILPMVPTGISSSWWSDQVSDTIVLNPSGDPQGDRVGYSPSSDSDISGELWTWASETQLTLNSPGYYTVDLVGVSGTVFLKLSDGLSVSCIKKDNVPIVPFGMELDGGSEYVVTVVKTGNQ